MSLPEIGKGQNKLICKSNNPILVYGRLVQKENLDEN
jgi:hypothetical protein